jgi:hypothetical protein
MLTRNIALIICVIGGIIYLFLEPKHWIVINLRRLAEIAFAVGLFCFLFLYK